MSINPSYLHTKLFSFLLSLFAQQARKKKGEKGKGIRRAWPKSQIGDGKKKPNERMDWVSGRGGKRARIWLEIEKEEMPFSLFLPFFRPTGLLPFPPSSSFLLSLSSVLSYWKMEATRQKVWWWGKSTGFDSWEESREKQGEVKKCWTVLLLVSTPPTRKVFSETLWYVKLHENSMIYRYFWILFFSFV